MELPKLTELSVSGEILSRPDRKTVLRYHKPNKEIHPEKYEHCLLIFFYPFHGWKAASYKWKCF